MFQLFKKPPKQLNQDLFKLQESNGNSTRETMLIFHFYFEGSKKTQTSMQLRYAKAPLSPYCLWSDPNSVWVEFVIPLQGIKV